MAGARPGKRASHLRQDKRRWEALEADLVIQGVVAEDTPTWILEAYIDPLLEDPTSHLARASGSDGWTRLEHLVCLVLDELRVANWQRSKNGTRRATAPKPVSPLAKNKGIKVGDRGSKTNEEVLAQLRSRKGPSKAETIKVGDPLPEG